MTSFKPIQFCMLNICLFLGTMGNIMVPKNNFAEKYDVYAFQRRVDHPHSFPGSKHTKFETFMVLLNFKTHSKM